MDEGELIADDAGEVNALEKGGNEQRLKEGLWIERAKEGGLTGIDDHRLLSREGNHA